MNTDEYVKINNTLREKLDKDNAEYYDDILLKVRVGAREEVATEEVLYEMLVDLLQAQDHGQTAIEYFGKESKILAEELIANLNKSTLKDIIVQIMIGLILFAQMNYTGKLFNSTISISILMVFVEVALAIMLCYLVITLIFKLVRRDASDKVIFGSIVIAVVIFTGMFIGLDILSNRLGLKTEVSHSSFGWTLLVINIVLGYIRFKNYETKKITHHLTTVFCLFVSVLAIAGVINSNINVQYPWLTLVFVGVYLVLFFIQSTLSIKNKIS